METIETDVAIIGAGSAGLNARREVIKAGKEWVMIEGGPLGTTCARVGCMPSKLLIAAAEAAHGAHTAHRFGVQIEPEDIHIDPEKVFGRVRAERDRFVGFVTESVESFEPGRLIRGWARFLDQTTLQVDDHTRVEAEAVVIATGSRPFIPPPLRPLGERVMVNDDVFELERVPPKLAVVGAGVIGLELGQALGRLGAEVHVFELTDQIGPFTDPEVNEAAREAMSAEMRLHLSAEITGAEALEDDDTLQLSWRDAEGRERRDTFTHVLAAAGRRPNIDRLGLEDLELPRDERGELITTPETTQLGDTALFIAGDASGHRPILHEASDEGRIAGYNAAHYPDVEIALRRTPLAIAFTDPQMAMVGERFADLGEGRIVIGQVSYANQGRARVMLQNQGLVRLYADRRDCRLIGGELLGPAVEHTAHLMAWAIQQKMRVPDILRMPVYHPVVEEGIRTALRDLARKLRVTSHCAPEDFAMSPGH